MSAHTNLHKARPMGDIQALLLAALKQVGSWTLQGPRLVPSIRPCEIEKSLKGLVSKGHVASIRRGDQTIYMPNEVD
jgi:hypothetical protein